MNRTTGLRCARPLAAILCCLFAGATSPAWGYTTESPIVQAMAERGVAYIEKNFGRGPMDDELGGVCICALACYAQTGEANHPLVQKALARIQEGARNGFQQGAHENYGLGIALVFLGALDPAPREEMNELLEEVYKRQQASGAWTYPGDPWGDTSQTQYACLGMWVASRHGLNVDQQAVERVCNWLLRVQEPSGVFPYKGEDPGNFTRIEQQTQSSASMCAAGTGSLYVCGELLGLIAQGSTETRTQLPPAFRPVPTEPGRSSAKGVDYGVWQLGVKDGDQWMQRHARVENFDEYHRARYQQYYYMYALERYAAFRELASGTRREEPSWYNAGVDYCRMRQARDGSWKSDAHQSASIDTAFAVLFLLRSSKTIVKALLPASGTLGGHPPGTLGPTDWDPTELLARLEDAPPTEYLSEIPKAYLSEIPKALVLPVDLNQRQAMLTRLRRLAVNGAFHARLVATRTLGTSRDLESAPMLIFALSDPDYRVAKAARDSLRFLSRMPEGFGFEIVNERPEKAVWTQAQADWTNWLLSVQPNAELLQ